jgi:amidase
MREASCLEALDYFIARAERLDGNLNAVVARDFERARAQARALDNGGAGGGRLHGVPMTVKESFDIAGLPSTWGFPERRGAIAKADALAVRRLKEAGAVIFGKTNVPKALADWQSYNAVYGATSNPWDSSRTPGGSSGGGAAAIAAGLSALELGSDIGGSIRVPAHFCGVFGHKPTWGLLPPRGHSPVLSAAMTDISVIGPLARSAEDLQLALDLLAVPDPAETALRYVLPKGPESLSGLRVAVWAEDAATHTDKETSAAILDLAAALGRAGAVVDTGARPGFDPKTAFHTYLRLLDAALSSRAPEADILARQAKAASLDPAAESADAIILRATGMTHRAWAAENERRHQIKRQWGAFFQDWDILLCPAFGVRALPRTETGETWERTTEVNGVPVPYNDMLFWPGITCGFYLPATVAPLGLNRAGLPLGVQIAGPLFGDRITIAAAGLIETLTGGFRPPPGWA